MTILTPSVIFASKDGENVAEKVYELAKTGAFTGSAFAIFTIRHKYWKKQLFPWGHARIFASLAGPVAASFVTYAFASQKIAQYRGKDGPLNHFLGTLPTAPFISMLYQKPPRIRALQPAIYAGLTLSIAKWEYPMKRPIKGLSKEVMRWDLVDQPSSHSESK